MSVKRDTPVGPLGVRSFVSHGVYLAISAVLLMLCFPPIGWWPVAYVALVPVGVLAHRSASGGRLFLAAWGVFFLWWAFMVRWVVSVHWLAVVIIALVCACYVAAACWALWWLVKRYRGAMTMLLPMVWITNDLVRGHFPFGGFAWFSLGHTQAAMTAGQSPGWVVQTADLFGEHTVGFIVAMTSGLIVDVLTRPLVRPDGAGFRRIRKTIRAAVVLWALAFFCALIYGRSRVASFESAGDVRVAVIQTDVPHNNKIHRTPEQDAADFVAMAHLSRDAARASPRPDVIVWPETMVPAALNGEAVETWAVCELYHAEVESLVHALGVPVIAGASFWAEPAPPPDVGVPLRRANSAYLYYADGSRAAARYDKRHLVPMGEYLPVVNSVPWLKRFYLEHVSPYPYDYSLRAGTQRTTFEIPAADGGVVRLVTPICYEDAVGRVTRDLVYENDGEKRADVVVNLTNSAWYAGGSMKRQHLQIAVLRAIENRVPIARAVNGGVSGFIDSCGRIGPVAIDGQAFLAATLNRDDRSTVYGRVGAMPIAGVALAVAALVLGGFLRNKRAKIEPDA